MKRASFTLFQPQRWISLLGKSTLMVLFVWCCIGIQNANAQSTPAAMVYTAGDTTCASFNLATVGGCKGEPVDGNGFEFKDDGNNDGNYNDSHMRRDTVEFCPTDNWSRVKVIFTKFDLEDGTNPGDNGTGDTLVVFNGNKDTVRTGAVAPTAVATGVGVFKAYGGWIYAECDPADNPSGCLTFVLRTDGDNNKGAGWEAWVDCESRGIDLGNVTVPSVKLTCATNATGVFADIEVPAAPISNPNSCTNVSDIQAVEVTNQFGEICFRDTLSPTRMNGIDSFRVAKFAIGIYTARYVLLSDTVKTTTDQFSVQAPSLVCNDDIVVPLGSACMIALTPDDILEQPCDTIAEHMYYNITVTIGEGKNQRTIITEGHDDAGPVVYPIITSEIVAAAGMTVCNATATVKIERIYYERLAVPFMFGVIPTIVPVCNNGVQRASCETTISFNDQSAPFITFTQGIDSIVTCDTTGLDAILQAKAIDNCTDNVPVTYTVQFEENDPCFSANGNAADNGTTRATIIWSATDDCGNNMTRSQTVTILRPAVRPVTPEPFTKTDDITRDCNRFATDQTAPLPKLRLGTINNGVFTQTATKDLSTTDYICGYIITKEDITIPATDCGSKIYRYYSVLDWCAPGNGPSRIDTTFIEFTDTLAPVFVDPAPSIVELGAFSCTYDATKHPLPSATDNCDDTPEVRLDAIFRIEDGGKWPVPAAEWTALDCDSFCLRYIVEDDCHEQEVNDTTLHVISIEDVTKPSAVCTDELIVSVPSSVGARIHWRDIDAGSTDACGIRTIEIRKEDSRTGGFTAWDSVVIIECFDVHNFPKVEMRVTDNKGNQNICWMTITAEDKIAPICRNLDNMTRTCDQFHNEELGMDTGGRWVALEQGGELETKYNTLFGNPQCEDNLEPSCSGIRIFQEYRLTERNCGELTLERRWRARDWEQALDDQGNLSNYGFQTITVVYAPNWTLNFPADVDLSCNDAFPPAWTAAQIIDNGSCDLFALEVTEKLFEVPGDICFKIERTYELINWCVYQAGEGATEIANGTTSITSAGANATKGRFTYTQVLKLYVNEAPEINILPVDSCITAVSGDAEPFGEHDMTPGSFPYECDEVKVFSAVATNCIDSTLGSDLFTYELFENEVLVKSGTGNTFDYTVQPKLTYRAKFRVSDGCGNTAWAEDTYKFWDCKRPTPYVLSSLSIEIMQTGMVQVWAKDLDRGSYDNCTPKDKLDFRIFHVTPTSGDGPSIDDLAAVQALGKNITFECPDDIGRQIVLIYVIDEEGNVDVVATEVRVQNNNNAAGCTIEPTGDGMVAGQILNPAGENVEQVRVSVNGGSEANTTTGATGSYAFELATGGDYTITPEKNINPLNGVSTYDLVLMSKHILGLQTFDTPYKYIAADVNKSGSITAFDMVELRKLILNITSEFPNNSSWRFVDAKYEFTTDNPAAENFGEFMSINNLDGEMMNVDFVATKIGDINGNATANSLLGAEARNTNGTLTISTNDRLVAAGETVTVDFTSTDIATTQGYQFTMNFAGLELNEVVEGVAKTANFNTNMAQRGVLTTSWDGKATANDVLFSLTFTANTAGLLSEIVSLNSDLTAAEAYNNAGELLDVTLDFNSSKVSASFGLEQNTPNPFNGETVIGFNLPKAGTATLKVMDVQGKVLRSIEGDYAKGYNQVTVNAKALGTTGVLYYQLESSDNIATKKMIIID